MFRRADPLLLSDDEKQRLIKISEYSIDRRERARARTVLLLSEGRSLEETASIQNLLRQAVTKHRDAWLERGFDGLKDLPRCGAPRQLTVEQRLSVCAMARAEALTASAIQVRLFEEHQVTVSTEIVRSVLREHGFLWKRTGYCLKKSKTL